MKKPKHAPRHRTARSLLVVGAGASALHLAGRGGEKHVYGVPTYMRALPRALAGAFVLLSVSSCGTPGLGTDLGATTGTATLTGDKLFVPRDAIAGANLGPFVDGPWASLCTAYSQVYISDLAGSCQNDAVAPHSIFLSLFVDPTKPDATVKAPGTFAVSLPKSTGTNMAFVSYGREGDFDFGAGGTVIFASSGTVVITEVSAQEIAGTFDVTTQQNHIAGSFIAPICSPWTRSDNIPGPINCL